MVMIKHKTIILLTVLMCFSSMSSSFMVMCHGSDDHIVVEPVGHNHCDRQESCETGNQNDLTGSVIALANDHDHCKDTVAISSFIVSLRKNFKLSTHKVFAANLCSKSVSIPATSFFRHLAIRSHELSSFFAPLRTVILLA